MVQLAFCDLLHTFHKQVTNVSQRVFVILGGQSGAAVRRPHGKHQDVGSNPAAARNEKNRPWADPCTEGVPIVWQDLSGRQAM